MTHMDNESLGFRRTGVVEDYPLIPYVSVDFFLGSVVPFVSPERLENIMKSLKSTRAITKNGRIRGFDIDPTSSSMDEVNQFAALHHFSERVLKKARRLLKANEALVLRYTPERTAWSERTDDSRPDAFWSRVDPDDATTPIRVKVMNRIVATIQGKSRKAEGWEDIVLAQEFMPHEKDRYDNYLKILWNAQHILRNDPRREFTYGITVENTACRFWFFARSHIMVTHPFSLITDPQPFVKFLVGLAFAHVLRNDDCDATHPLKAHGYDPTVERLGRPGEYAFDIGGRRYITCRVLSDFRAESICGRCTRVWEVYEDGCKDKRYVLKDVWVDWRSETEAEIWCKLKSLVDEEVFDKHFLTLVASVPTNESRTTCSFMGRSGYSAKENMYFFTENSKQDMDLWLLSTSNETQRASRFMYPNHIRSKIVGAPDDSGFHLLHHHPNHPFYIPRKHDRSVWKEVCTPYHNLTSMPLMMQTLKHSVVALEAMWKDARAIHRNLNTDNVLYDNIHHVGRLGDLASVTFYTDAVWARYDNGPQNDKTGTLEFMAVEVRDGKYYFRPHRSKKPADITPTFFHNPLHGLESIWWLLLWTLLRYHPDSPPPYDTTALWKQSHSYLAHFSGTGSVRLVTFALADDTYLEELPPSIRNTCIPELSEEIVCLLVERYKTVEKSFPIQTAAFDGVHSDILTCVQEIRRVLQDRQIDKVVKVESLLRNVT